MDLTGPSIIPFRLKQKELLLFLANTEQAMLDGMHIKTCLRVIKKLNYINTLATCTVALFWPFITEAHKK